ncbi:MAG: helix-turn-helix transcriptional regulator [Pseudobacteriovorax sp.]|nr:helix-turn-helix transcriptional regulator [Pseudobacteriovorax sp.]
MTLLQTLQPKINEFSSKHELSRREKDVLEQLVQGNTSGAEISSSLGISPNTVRIHLKNINIRVGVHSKTEALASFLRHVVTN